MATLTKPIRMLHQIGVKTLVLSNAAGGIRSDLSAGDFMLLEDHINFMGYNPLIGLASTAENRFPDMTDVYDLKLRQIALELAACLNFDLQRGVYLATTGPSFETPAEIRAFACLGADAVGMSNRPGSHRCPAMRPESTGCPPSPMQPLELRNMPYRIKM